MKVNTSKEELIYLADQQASARARYHEDDADLIRESMVIEHALRYAARESTAPQSSVKRYCIHYDARGEYEHPKGDFVHWSDYQALVQRLTAVEIQSSDGGAGSRRAISKQRINEPAVNEGRTTSVAAAGDMAGVAPGPSEAHDGGPPGPSPLAVKPGSSDPASGRGQPSPDVSVDELARIIERDVVATIHIGEGDAEVDGKLVARALLASYRIERLDRLASGRR